MYWLGLDFETTGLDSKKERITEVGAVLWDVKKGKPLRMLSELCYDYSAGVPQVSEEITKITGIDSEMLDRFGANTEAALLDLNEMASHAEFFVAHNAPFDRSFYEAECERLGCAAVGVPWIDTLTDVPYETDGSRSLSYLAADHGFLNPFPHRAIFDVMTMFKVISNYDAETVKEWNMTPNVIVRALVQFSQKDLAKNLSYKWNSEKKWWVKTIKEFQIDMETMDAHNAGFEIEVMREQSK